MRILKFFKILYVTLFYDNKLFSLSTKCEPQKYLIFRSKIKFLYGILYFGRVNSNTVCFTRLSLFVFRISTIRVRQDRDHYWRSTMRNGYCGAVVLIMKYRLVFIFTLLHRFYCYNVNSRPGISDIYMTRNIRMNKYV